jgi:Uma2 family endonuclease
MPPRALVLVEEYLSTSYDPDCDYVDGRVVERNWGELDHSDLQTELCVYFRLRRKKWGVYAFVEQRVQVSPTRFRIPDICVMLGPKPTEPIIRTPPFLVIEILSSEDRMPRVLERIDDYLRFGVGYVWVIDPGTKEGWVHTRTGVEPAADGILWTRNPQFDVSLPDIFAALRDES